jgi:hypothetical protein
MNPITADLLLPPAVTSLTAEPTAPWPAPEVVELALLLPRWQIEALEEAARDRGVTVGTMIRRFLGDLLRRQDTPGTRYAAPRPD